ncbi:E2 domain-containing protein [Mesorhizobium sp. M0244]|uniref:E2 domain-containing protein n=1 Tax=Mesorhizobium sp. M0244 TaxID=2956926 RepID=UPI003339BA9E
MSTTTDRSTIESLRNRASEVGALVLSSTDTQLEVSLSILRTSGAVVPFALHIECRKGLLTVHEVRSRHLPEFCPERHINDGGTFCLYWKPLDGIEIDSAEAATEWWSTVVAFLRLQLRAAKLRRWPNRRGRAHGNAAQYQHAAEGFARQLGLEDDLLEGGLRVVKGGRGAFGRALRLLRRGHKILSVWQEVSRVVTVRRPCICGQGDPPKAMICCGDHAAVASQLVSSIDKMQQLEAAFMDMYADRQCCGTMDECPLKTEA